MMIRTVALLALAPLGLLGGTMPGKAAEARPNIVIAIADDWSWPHAGAYGDTVVRTPVFDRLAAEGVKFTRAYCVAPSCTPSRGAILTGQAVHRLEEGGNLWSFLPRKFACYPDLLEAAGYHVGLTGKGWGPGTLEGSGRTRNPAGPAFKNFEQFLRTVPEGRPFCYWFGSQDPHRPYEPGAGLRAGMRLQDVVVPPSLPDTPEIRGDILDYDFEVQRFDSAVGEVLKQLEATGRAEDTLVVITSDNGMPFPRAKANVYDSGSHMPLAVRWPAKFPGGRTVDAFVSLADLAPTFLEAAGLKPLPEMTGRSLLGLLAGEDATERDQVFVERERHANVRAGDLSYPVRAVRTRQFLYVRNLRPDRWPAGDPQMWKEVGPFGDVDGSPTKDFILERRNDPKFAPYFRLAFAKRPAEELYDLAKDPGELTNLATRPEYAAARHDLRAALDRWMAETADPRALADDDRWDRYPYFSAKRAAASK
jgi:N-sulfoglucosamine sulfohydrolase